MYVLFKIFFCSRFYHCNNLRGLQKSPNYFPEEFYKTGAFFIYEKDKENNLTLHFRIRYLRRIKELRSTMEFFGAFMFYTVDRLADGQGWIFAVDFDDARLSNADLELCKYVITFFRTIWMLNFFNILFFFYFK